MTMDFETKDSGERRQFDSGMVRDVDSDKILWHLTASGPMLQRWAELMTRGVPKYGEDNWLLAEGEEEYKRFRSSAYRHFMQWWKGLEPDEDHAAAVMFNIDGAEYVKEKIRVSEPFKQAFRDVSSKMELEVTNQLKTHNADEENRENEEGGTDD